MNKDTKEVLMIQCSIIIGVIAAWFGCWMTTTDNALAICSGWLIIAFVFVITLYALPTEHPPR